MRRDQWISLGLEEEGLDAYAAGHFRTVEAADEQVAAFLRDGTGHRVLGTASSREEAVVIATILRMFMPG